MEIQSSNKAGTNQVISPLSVDPLCVESSPISQPSREMISAGFACFQELREEVGSAFLVQEVWLAMERARLAEANWDR